MGRPRKPTALKLLQGNAGKRALPKGEPQSPVGSDRPSYLSHAALGVWDELAPKLAGSRVLTELDGAALASLCNLEANKRELIALKGKLKPKGPDDVVTLAARLKVMAEERKLAPQLNALYGRFGMTPADRAKVSTTSDKQESDLARFIGGS